MLTDGLWKATLWSDFILEPERLCLFPLEPKTDLLLLRTWQMKESRKWPSLEGAKGLSRMIGDGQSRRILVLRLIVLLAAGSSNFRQSPQVNEFQARDPLCTKEARRPGVELSSRDSQPGVALSSRPVSLSVESAFNEKLNKSKEGSGTLEDLKSLVLQAVSDLDPLTGQSYVHDRWLTFPTAEVRVHASWDSQNFVYSIWKYELSGVWCWKCSHDFDHHRRWSYYSMGPWRLTGTRREVELDRTFVGATCFCKCDLNFEDHVPLVNDTWAQKAKGVKSRLLVSYQSWKFWSAILPAYLFVVVGVRSASNPNLSKIRTGLWRLANQFSRWTIRSLETVLVSHRSLCWTWLTSWVVLRFPLLCRRKDNPSIPRRSWDVLSWKQDGLLESCNPILNPLVGFRGECRPLVGSRHKVRWETCRLRTGTNFDDRSEGWLWNLGSWFTLPLDCSPCSVVDQSVLGKGRWVGRLLKATLTKPSCSYSLSCQRRKEPTVVAWRDLAWTRHWVGHALCGRRLRGFSDQEHPPEHPFATGQDGTFAKHQINTLGSFWFQAWNQCFHTSTFQRWTAVAGSAEGGLWAVHRPRGPQRHRH